MNENAFDWTGVIDTVANRPAVQENNLLQNRLMSMQVDEKSQSMLAQKSKENYLMGYDPNKPVSELPRPKNVGEFQAYQEIQTTEQANTKAITDTTMNTYMEGFFNNDPIKMSKAVEFADNNPIVQNQLKQKGIYAAMKRTKPIDPSAGAYETDMPLTADAIKQLAAQPGTGISPDTPPGYFHVRYISPPGTSPLDKTKAQLLSVKPFSPTKDQLADWSAAGDKQATAMLASRAQVTKDFSEPYTMKIGGKPVLVQKNKQTGEIKRLAEDKSTTVTVTAGGGGAGESFKSYSPEMKKTAFEDYMNTGKIPDFGGKRTNNPDYKTFTKQYYDWRTSGKITAGDVAEHRSDVAAMKDLTKREQLIGTFTNRIDATSNVVLDLARKYGNRDNRLLNVGINTLASKVGSGDYQALKLAITSLSREVAKVESGSIGIAAVPEGQSEIMDKIHDADLSINDLVKIINTGKSLGKTSKEALIKQRAELRERINTTGAAPSARATSGGNSYQDLLNKHRNP